MVISVAISEDARSGVGRVTLQPEGYRPDDVDA
jgi:hypothetical protein